MIVAAGNSPRGQGFAARNADMMFTNLRGDISEMPGSVAALRELSGEFNRDIGVFSNVSVVCRPTEKEAEEYFYYYAIENADWDAVENLIEGRGVKNLGISDEALKAARIRAAAGNGALPIVGSPDDVVVMMKRLSGFGIKALAMGLTNYIEQFPYIRDEILPRLEREGLRAG